MQYLLASLLFLAFSGSAQLLAQDKSVSVARNWGPAVAHCTNVFKEDIGRGATGARSRLRGKEIPPGVSGHGLYLNLEGGGACYDLDTMRLVGAWSGGFIGGNRDKTGWMLVPRGTVQFGTRQHLPGWCFEGKFNDPREHAGWGLLPEPYPQYLGRYRFKNEIVLKYRIDEFEVLEQVHTVKLGANLAFVRRFERLGDAKRPAQILIASELGPPATNPPEHTVAFQTGDQLFICGASDKAITLKTSDHRLFAEIPAEAPALFYLYTAILPYANASEISGLHQLPPAVLRDKTKGGPAIFGGPEITQGTLGNDDFAYTVDTLSIPQDNRWKISILPAGIDFFKDGRIAVCSWEGDVFVIAGIDERLVELRWTRFASGLNNPLGLKIADEKIMVVSKDGLTRLHDLNGDGEADWYECFNMQGPPNIGGHAYNFSLQTDSEGNWYYCNGSHRGIVNPQGVWGCIAKVSPDGKKLEVYCDGFRENNSLSIGPDDTIISADNPGSFGTPFDAVVQGQTYGFGGTESKRNWEQYPPLLWAHKAMESSAGDQAWVPPGRGWKPIDSGLVHTSYSKSAFYLMMLDRKQPTVQAALYKFPLAFESGIMRVRFHPVDGMPYVAGLRGWDTNAAKPGCVQRVRPTGKLFPGPVGYEVTTDSIKISFAQELDRAYAEDPENWAAIAHKIRKALPTPTVPLNVLSLKLLEDKRTVAIAFDKFAPYDCIEFKYSIKSADGQSMTDSFIVTINRIP